MTNPLEQFLSEIEVFLTDSGMKPAAFGRAAAGDPGFVFSLREGREPRFSTMTKVREWMAANAEERAA